MIADLAGKRKHGFERERAVFLARSMADTDHIPSLEAFADRFGVSTTRVRQLEISARRKIAVALAASGYEDAVGDDVVAHLSQIRARRAAVAGASAPRYRVTANDTFAMMAAAD